MLMGNQLRKPLPFHMFFGQDLAALEDKMGAAGRLLLRELRDELLQENPPVRATSSRGHRGRTSTLCCSGSSRRETGR